MFWWAPRRSLRLSEWIARFSQRHGPRARPALPSASPLRMNRSNSGTGSGDDHSRASQARYQPIEPDSASRTEEHTSELQSLIRNSYAVFSLKKKKNINNTLHTTPHIL